MVGCFSGILLCYSIYIIEIIYHSPFCYTSLSYGVPYSFVTSFSIFSHKTPAPFCLIGARIFPWISQL